MAVIRKVLFSWKWKVTPRVLRLPLCLVMRRDKNFDWFTRVTWEGARTKSHDFVKISSWGNKFMKKPIDVADRRARSKAYWTLNCSTIFYLLSITAWGGWVGGDHPLSLEFIEIDLFLLHLTISSPSDVRSQVPCLRTILRVLPKQYNLNPKFHLLNWVFLDVRAPILWLWRSWPLYQPFFLRLLFSCLETLSSMVTGSDHVTTQITPQCAFYTLIGGALRPRLSGKLLWNVDSPEGHVGNAEARLNIILYSDWL